MRTQPGVRPDGELVEAHMAFASSIARQYFIPGSDRRDVEQEAFAALVEAARSYQPTLGTFATFAAVVVRRRLYDRMSYERRDRRRLNHETIGDIEIASEYGGEPLHLIECLPDRDSDPADIAEARQRFSSFVKRAAALSATEREALLLVYDGEEYAHRPDSKRIDNAVQRARKKLREAA